MRRTDNFLHSPTRLLPSFPPACVDLLKMKSSWRWDEWVREKAGKIFNKHKKCVFSTFSLFSFYENPIPRQKSPRISPAKAVLLLRLQWQKQQQKHRTPTKQHKMIFFLVPFVISFRSHKRRGEEVKWEMKEDQICKLRHKPGLNEHHKFTNCFATFSSSASPLLRVFLPTLYVWIK